MALAALAAGDHLLDRGLRRLGDRALGGRALEGRALEGIRSVEEEARSVEEGIRLGGGDGARVDFRLVERNDGGVRVM